MKFFDRYQGWLHVIGWVIFIALPYLTLPDFIWNKEDLISISMSQLLTSVLIISFFYINLRKLTPALLRHQSIEQFLLTLGAMLVAVGLVKFACYYWFPPAAAIQFPPAEGAFLTKDRMGALPRRNPGPGGPHSPWPGVLSSSISFGFAMLVSSLMALFRYHTRSQEQQQQMVLEKVSAELAMLKLQVSPHFLFNTLNNIRWLARRKSDQTEAAIVTLAQLLRYMIYQAQQDKVSLRQEVQHLQHYIDLQKMRLTDNHEVTFHCQGDIDTYQIEPLLFIPFVENAFKYGLHSQQPSHIQISMNVSNNTLTFTAENSVFEMALPVESSLPNQVGTEGDRVASSGIGIINVQKRLSLHYPGQHNLQLTNQDHTFRVVLTIHLHHDEVALHRH